MKPIALKSSAVTSCALVYALLLWVVSAAAASDAPRVMVQTALQPPGPVVAGQQVRLVVTVLTTTWFLHAPEFPELSVPNAVITLPDERAVNLNQTMDGVQWFGLSRAYLVTPAGTGDVVIPPFEVTLWPGQASGSMRVKTAEITLPVRVVPRPAGAENMPASSSVKVTQHLDRTLEGLKVGDAFTRTVEVTAADLQGMFIPPTSFARIEGLAVYPATGKVDNILRDGQGFVGSRRSDAATYVVQQAGDYTLPGVTIKWWNTRTGTVEKAEAPALRFNAAANPGYKPEFDLPDEHGVAAGAQVNGLHIAALTGAGLAALWLLYTLVRLSARTWQRVRIARMEKQRRYLASAPAAYHRFEQAAQGGDARATYAALLAWADHPDRPARLRGLAVLCNGNAALRARIDALRASAYGATAVSWQAQSLVQEVDKQRALQSALSHERASLPPLNPA